MGGLYVTNFKLAFMPPKLESNVSTSQRVLLSSCHRLDDLLADDETGSHSEYIPLTSIWYITAISTVKQVSKRLKPGKVPSKKYDIIELSCKDLRVIRFDFSLCREKDRASILNAIHVYMSPTSIQKLFAFDHARGSQNTSNASSQGRAFHTFRHEKDLELELARLKAQEKWRISHVNEKFSVSKTLPELNLVPSSLLDQDLESISNFYEGGRFPTMVWHSRESGASLLCSSRPRLILYYFAMWMLFFVISVAFILQSSYMKVSGFYYNSITVTKMKITLGIQGGSLMLWKKPAFQMMQKIQYHLNCQVWQGHQSYQHFRSCKPAILTYVTHAFAIQIKISGQLIALG